ncbi:MAG: hypothetical protein JW850_12155 [Thermoflexales bacterium]|nr:hypothetical protein [Thermoflexales bacterium]
MDNDLSALVMSLLPVLVAGGMLILGLAFAYFNRQRRRQAWTELAERTGLTFEPGGFLGGGRVTGNYRGYDLRLDTFTRRHGRSSTTYTRIVLSLSNPTSLELALSNEGVFGKLGKLLGAQDIQTGDEELDRRFVVKGQPAEAIVTLLTAGGLRYRLLETPSSFKLELKNQQLYYEQRGAERNVDHLQSTLTLLSELAAAAERRRSSTRW